MKILIKSAKIVDQTNRELHLKKRDILIRNGIIEKIAPKIEETGKFQLIEKKNLHISPGWFDSSVSFGEPGYEERETIAHGLDVAARSGFTDIVLNPNTNPVPDSSSDIVFFKNAAKGCLANLHPLGALTVKCEGKDLAELYDMKNAGAVGYYDFKRPVENSNLLKIALQYVQNFDGLVYSFPLNKNISGKGIVNESEVSTRLGLKGLPNISEELQVQRDLTLLEYTGGKLHIPTISTAKSVGLIRAAKKNGLDVSCSVAVHNLFLTDSVLENFDSSFKVMPPLRTKTDTEALITGLKEGVVDYICSDHLPLNIEEKHREFDNATPGSIGLETAFGISNRLFELPTVIDLLTRGRERYGLETIRLSEGSRASLTLFDPDKHWVFNEKDIYSTSKNCMFVGAELKGLVYGIINNGQMNIRE
ncbi:dihydroorotase [Pareuzebyella sediminis]|uniref:dihydroorotase n=1 Tax=Pareuzebyella sediminis TaxID=2607998 RepID=UPI0011ECC95E|nr:dihydroorotase [Pareuzebyella sediminis]